MEFFLTKKITIYFFFYFFFFTEFYLNIKIFLIPVKFFHFDKKGKKILENFFFNFFFFFKIRKYDIKEKENYIKI
jgi:hypothetical protein